MTVAQAGAIEGNLNCVVSEKGLNTDAPVIEFEERRGFISAMLTIGVDPSTAKPLKANDGICSPGVKLHGSGFIVTPQEASHLGLGRRAGLERYILKYRNGRDLTSRPRGVMVIDLFGLTAEEVRERFPEVYQHLRLEVKEKPSQKTTERSNMLGEIGTNVSPIRLSGRYSASLGRRSGQRCLR
jgi:hypothetical protein